ncbi:hypothetical protein D3093_33685 (plasmid) [Azospirillum argentinense]|uniref:Uncharacterized protein n=1 Tax=Azospirillum argentinense TaxID=2970906 RepID=A0A4D8PTT0_9PROT|nr:hypothetical protein D3093_33685 [Azospirillum argentinense]
MRPYTALRMFENAEASVAVRAGGIVTLEIPVGDYNDLTKRAVWEQLAKEMADDRAGFILLPTIIDKEGKKVCLWPAISVTRIAPGKKVGWRTPTDACAVSYRSPLRKPTAPLAP